MENYIIRNYRKIELVVGEPIDIVDIGDVSLKMSNKSIWKIQR